MRHPQEVPLVVLKEGQFVPSPDQAGIRGDLDDMAFEGIDTQPYEYAYRTQLSRQMLDLSKGEE